MHIFPAIDLLGGKVVRLFHGDYNKVTVYNDFPEKQVESFQALGAKRLHIVDLDGAKSGGAENLPSIKKIIENCNVFTQLGGGIRSIERIETYLSLGINRVILGSAALRDPQFLNEAIKLYGEKIAVGVDARNGKVATDGWLKTSDTDSFDFCKHLAEIGVCTVIYTDISRDGALSGTNLEAYQKLTELKGLNIVASGGITFYEELEALERMGTYGAIIGKAHYDGKLDLQKIIGAMENDN